MRRRDRDPPSCARGHSRDVRTRHRHPRDHSGFLSEFDLGCRRLPEGAVKADKHQWLYLNSSDSVERLRTFVAFYVEQHNTQMPRAAFSGQTPAEMYFGMAAKPPAELAAARQLAYVEVWNVCARSTAMFNGSVTDNVALSRWGNSTPRSRRTRQAG